MSTIAVQDAVKRAKAALADLFFDETLKALALEEIELVQEQGRPMWAVTLGFHRPKQVSVVEPAGRSSLFFRDPPPTQVEHRVYKTVFIDARTGEFVKMDIRQVQ